MPFSLPITYIIYAHNSICDSWRKEKTECFFSQVKRASQLLYHYPLWLIWFYIRVYAAIICLCHRMICEYCSNGEITNVDLPLSFRGVGDAMLQVLRCFQSRQSGHLLIFDSTKTSHYLSMYDPTLNAMYARPKRTYVRTLVQRTFNEQTKQNKTNESICRHIHVENMFHKNT